MERRGENVDSYKEREKHKNRERSRYKTCKNGNEKMTDI
jgi:hypothetical protein